jgi:hypothetical protein
MFCNRFFKLFVSLVLTVSLTFTGMIPVIGEIHPAYAADILTSSKVSYYSLVPTHSSTNGTQLDKDRRDAIISAHDSTQEFATSELDDWVNELMRKVDDKFLNWYFSYGNQKAQEFGIPFAWLAFKVDEAFKLLKKNEEADLTAKEILQKRAMEDFSNKLNDLVIDESSQESLEKLIKRVGRYYSSEVGKRFADIKNGYQIPEVEWESYSNQIASIVYDTGNSSPEILITQLIIKLFAITTIGAAGKAALAVALDAAAKALVAKISTGLAGKALVLVMGKVAGAKTGTVIAASSSVILLPLMAAGIAIWDVWDYKKMVKESRPVLRQNILAYFNEVKLSILNSPENSIMAAIEEVESKIITGLESRLTS